MAQPKTRSKALKRKVYLVKYQMNGEMTGGRFYDEQEAKRAYDDLKRNGYKRVRIVTKIAVLL